MKKIIILLITLILITGCAKQITISDNETAEELPVVEEILGENATEPVTEEPIEEPVENVTEEVEEVPEGMPEIYKKCQYSAISYAGCWWLNEEKSSFELTIASGAPGTIPGLWFIIHGANETKYIKKTESLLKRSSRAYVIIYKDLVEEIGPIGKFEVLSIEEIDGREVACQNQRTSFVPVNNCRVPAEYNHVS